MAGAVYQVGELIENRYRVLSVFETGGMGVLYRVSDEARADAGARDGEVVALKTVKVDLPGVGILESVERFQREFQILTQLRHPNLVSVYNYGVTPEGELYFTMEWAPGQPLDAQKLRLELVAVIPVMVQMCRALAYLHARGVIHGDLKPSNVLIEGEQVKIVDFGVALEARSAEVRAKYYTPGYTAPEVREQRAVDQRMDLYSLGALWYALVVGEPPMFMIGAERLIRLALDEALERQEQIPAEISAVIARLLSSSPEDRYASADEVIEAINRVMGSAYALETRETAGSYALRVRFVDREAEIKVLQTVWEQARLGEGELVLVSGEAGVGKTRLLEEFIVQAEMEGARVARGQCVEGGGVAYRPWREALRVLIRYVEVANEGPMKRVGPVVATLLPELWERPYMAGLAQPAELDSQSAQQRLNSAIVEVLRAAAGLRPTVVVIEDAHWADEATLALLTFLARILKPAALLVSVTCRDDEIGPQHPLAALLASRIERIPLRTLPPEITTDLARLMLGLEELPPSLVERVQQVTGGNAFFTQELIRTLAEDGVVLQRTVEGWRVDEAALQRVSLPASIRQVVGQRLGRLSAQVQQVLQWASIVGPIFWDGVVDAIGQVSRMQVQTALSEGLERALLIERGSSAFVGEREYMFTHPTVREVSYAGVSPQARREAHGRVAAWLMAHSDEELGEHLGLIADHLEKAGQMERAVTYLRRAGEKAAAQFANAEAIGYFSRALALTPENDLETRYALVSAREKVYDLRGIREAQAQDLAALQQLAEAMGDAQRRAYVALRWAEYADVTGDYPAGIVAVQEAIRLAQAAHDISSEAASHLEWGVILWRQGNPELAQVQLERASSLAEAAGTVSSGLLNRAIELRRIKVRSLHYLGVTFVLQGDDAEARAYYEQALHAYREIGDRIGESAILNNLGVVCAHLGDYVRAKDYFEQSLRVSREIGDRWNENTTVEGLGLLHHQLGDDEAAREYSLQALDISRESDNRRIRGYVLTDLGHALAGLGRLAEAADAYQQALTLRRELGQHKLAIESLAGLSRISLARGDLPQALAEVNEIWSYVEEHGLSGTEEPFRIYLTCYQVFNAHHDPRAQTVLGTAYHLLQGRAAKIADEEMRRSFLENVPAHREIVSEFARSQ